MDSLGMQMWIKALKYGQLFEYCELERIGEHILSLWSQKSLRRFIPKDWPKKTMIQSTGSQTTGNTVAGLNARVLWFVFTFTKNDVPGRMPYTTRPERATGSRDS